MDERYWWTIYFGCGSTGGFVLTAGASSSPLIINTTHNEGWEAESLSSWITYTKTEEGIPIKVTENSGGERRGSIIVKSGNLEKVITIPAKEEKVLLTAIL